MTHFLTVLEAMITVPVRGPNVTVGKKMLCVVLV
jgi:hypothetical protein